MAQTSLQRGGPGLKTPSLSLRHQKSQWVRSMLWWRKPIVSFYWSEAKLSQSTQSILLAHMLSEKGGRVNHSENHIEGKRLLSVMDIWHASVSGLICPTTCINSPLILGREGTIKGTSEVTHWFYFLSLWHVCTLTHRHVHTLISCVSLRNKVIIRMENSAWQVFIYILPSGTFTLLWEVMV